VTDSAGRFSFADVQPGADLIQVYDFSRSSSPILEYTLQIAPDSATVLHLVLLQPQTRVGSVEGFVRSRSSTTATPTPLPGAIAAASDSLFVTVSDATGHYRLDAVPIGTRKVKVYDPASHRLLTQDVVVQEGLVSSQDFTFDPPAAPPTRTIRGRVFDPLDAPVAGAGVAEFDGSGNVVRSAIADSAGNYVLTDVPPGGHTFYALGRDSTSGVSRDDVGMGTINFAGTGEGSLDIHLSGWGTVRGTVMGSHLNDVGQQVNRQWRPGCPDGAGDGEDRAAGLIAGPATLSTPGRRRRFLRTDGTYAFANVLGGSYTLLCHHAIYGDKNATAILAAGQNQTQTFTYENALS
jgi:hypothetical protein